MGAASRNDIAFINDNGTRVPRASWRHGSNPRQSDHPFLAIIEDRCIAAAVKKVGRVQAMIDRIQAELRRCFRRRRAAIAGRF
jgi:hypothetical protein